MHPLYEIAGNFYFLKEHKYVKSTSPSMSAVPLQKYMLQVFTYICPIDKNNFVISILKLSFKVILSFKATIFFNLQWNEKGRISGWFQL